MSDFCKTHSIELFGKDFGDLAELITKEEVESGLGAVVLCESCGVIRVDHNGERIDETDNL